MEQRKRRKKENRNLKVIIVILLVVLFVLFVGILGINGKKNINENKNQDQDVNIEQDMQGSGVVSGNQNTQVNESQDDQESGENLEEEKGFDIETLYATLCYPEKWKDVVTVRKIDGTYFTVGFYGTIGEKTDIQLFDMIFGGEEGFTLGYLQVEDVTINVNIISYDEEAKAVLSDEEFTT